MARDLITSDSAIRTLKHDDGRKRISDCGGLYLLPFVRSGRPRISPERRQLGQAVIRRGPLSGSEF